MIKYLSMENKFNELTEYIKLLENFKLPEYKEISTIPLYMEQVIGYIDSVLKEIKKEDNSVITPFMVNNYVKAKIVSAPENKKYDKDHIAYLLAISLLKESASMSDIATLIDMDKYLTDDKQKLYSMFKNMHDEVLKNQTHRVKIRLDAVNKDKKKKSDSLEDNLNLSYIALRLYIESETSKIIADQIMNTINKEKEKPETKLTKKANKLENKKESKQAKELSQRKSK